MDLSSKTVSPTLPVLLLSLVSWVVSRLFFPPPLITDGLCGFLPHSFVLRFPARQRRFGEHNHSASLIISQHSQPQAACTCTFPKAHCNLPQTSLAVGRWSAESPACASAACAYNGERVLGGHHRFIIRISCPMNCAGYNTCLHAVAQNAAAPDLRHRGHVCYITIANIEAQSRPKPLVEETSNKSSLRHRGMSARVQHVFQADGRMSDTSTTVLPAVGILRKFMHGFVMILKSICQLHAPLPRA